MSSNRTVTGLMVALMLIGLPPVTALAEANPALRGLYRPLSEDEARGYRSLVEESPQSRGNTPATAEPKSSPAAASPIDPASEETASRSVSGQNAGHLPDYRPRTVPGYISPREAERTGSLSPPDPGPSVAPLESERLAGADQRQAALDRFASPADALPVSSPQAAGPAPDPESGDRAGGSMDPKNWTPSPVANDGADLHSRFRPVSAEEINNGRKPATEVDSVVADINPSNTPPNPRIRAPAGPSSDNDQGASDTRFRPPGLIVGH